VRNPDPGKIWLHPVMNPMVSSCLVFICYPSVLSWVSSEKLMGHGLFPNFKPINFSYVYTTTLVLLNSIKVAILITS
jgi:hypothetical protein